MITITDLKHLIDSGCIALSHAARVGGMSRQALSMKLSRATDLTHEQARAIHAELVRIGHEIKKMT